MHDEFGATEHSLRRRQWAWWRSQRQIPRDSEYRYRQADLIQESQKEERSELAHAAPVKLVCNPVLRLVRVWDQSLFNI